MQSVYLAALIYVALGSAWCGYAYADLLFHGRIFKDEA